MCSGTLAQQDPATRAQAEAALLDFRRSGSVEAAVGLLQAAGEEGVQFQAVLALREIVLGRWAVVGRPAARATLRFLLELALGRLAADPRPLLRTQVNATAAAVIKRGWLDSEPAERDAALQVGLAIWEGVALLRVRAAPPPAAGGELWLRWRRPRASGLPAAC